MTLINQLRNIYPSLIVSKKDALHYPGEYMWYQTPHLETIGIPKTDLNQRESHLLPLFLTPVKKEQGSETKREEAWRNFLNHKSEKLTIAWPKTFRFVFFSIQEHTLNKETFYEALQSLFPKNMPLIWENDHEGYIIEELHTEHQEIISYQDMIDVLMSDFYTKIRFYISEFTTDISLGPSIFQWSKQCFTTAQSLRIGAVVTYKDVIPYLFVNALPANQKLHISRSILNEVIDDNDLLQTIRVFLESGSNATLAAKQLYMHRNSLQYRVDKFVEKTGIDVKQFQGALTTYLALMALEL